MHSLLHPVLVSVSDHIVSSQSSLLDRRPMFVLVSLFLICLPVFILLLLAEYHNVLMCVSHCVARIRHLYGVHCENTTTLHFTVYLYTHGSCLKNI